MTKKLQTASLLLLTALLAGTVVSCGAEASSGCFSGSEANGTTSSGMSGTAEVGG